MLEETEIRTIGKYEILGPLGRGTMGMVYKGRDPEIGRLVAIKTLRKFSLTAAADTEASMERFRHEARSAGNLRHPNIITIFEVGRDGDTPFIVMDYVEGKTLDQILERERRLSPDRALHYLSQVAEALDYAHQKNVIHKDIKPANIFVDNANNVFILDFGIAAITESFESGAESVGPALGTPGYMSPEQVLSERLDSRTDLFSLAIVAFESLTGQRPFPGRNFTEVIGNILKAKPQSLTALAPELPLALEAEFERALAKKKSSRFATAQEMIDALARALGMTNRSGQGFLKPSVDTTAWEAPRPRARVADVRNTGEPAPGMGRKVARTIPQSLEVSSASGSASQAAGRSGPNGASLLQLVTLVAGTVALVVALGLFYLVYAPRDPKPTSSSVASEGATVPGEAPIESAAIVGSSPREPLLKPATERPAMGVPTAQLTDKQLLGVLVDPDSSEGVLVEALREGIKRKPSQLVDACVQPLQNDSYAVRIEAIKTVAQLGDRRIVPNIIASLDDHDPLVRGHAARALGALGDRAALAAISERMVAEDVPEVQAAMRGAIERLNGGLAPTAAQ
ncbi:MAG: hypothetical protein EBZ48_06985 [Proteobacteria bacterium]|nr:hypothetical protein [Pseudomonadota bacterium]